MKPRLSQRLATRITIGFSILSLAVIISTIRMGTNNSAFAELTKENIYLQSKVNAQVSINVDDAPVHITRLQSTLEKGYAAVSWETVIEKNITSFIIERSVNGKPLEVAGTVNAAKAGSGFQKYDFRDEIKTENAGAFYCISYLTVNNEKKFLALTRAEDIETAGKLVYFSSIPQVLNKAFNMTYFTASSASVCVELMDAKGKNLFKAYTKSISGFNTCRMTQDNGWTPGEYTLRISTNYGVALKKIQVI